MSEQDKRAAFRDALERFGYAYRDKVENPASHGAINRYDEEILRCMQFIEQPQPPNDANAEEVARLEFLADRLTWPQPIRADLDLAEQAIRRFAQSLQSPEPARSNRWELTDEKINHLQVASVDRLIARCKLAHFVDVRVRINGEYEYHETDWIKHMRRLPAVETEGRKAIGVSALIRDVRHLLGRLAECFDENEIEFADISEMLSKLCEQPFCPQCGPAVMNCEWRCCKCGSDMSDGLPPVAYESQPNDNHYFERSEDKWFVCKNCGQTMSMHSHTDCQPRCPTTETSNGQG